MPPSLSSAVSPPSQTEVLDLLRAGMPPHVSLFVPTEREWNKTKDNQLRLKTLLKAAQARLREHDASSGRLLRPAFDLLDDNAFWAEATDGLAVFAAGSHFSTHRLPFSVTSQQFVDRRFHVRPLWRRLEPDGPFYLLALSQGGVTLFRGSRFAIEEVPLHNVPTSLDEALQFDEHIRSITFHTRSRPGAAGDPGRRAAMYHGHEDAGDKAYVKDGILRFFRELDNEVCRLLGQQPTPPPLVLAGVDALRGLYRKANHYAHLTDADVEGHFVDWSEATFDVDTLHEQAWAIAASRYEEDRHTALQRFEQLSGTERSVSSLHKVIGAAYHHRIDTLFVAETAAAWGRYDPTTHETTVHTKRTPADEELLNAAVAWTLAGSGTVYVMDAESVPSRTPAAALLRF